MQEAHPAEAWADQFATERLPEQWAAEFGGAAADTAAGREAGGDGEYVFAQDNPFLQARLHPTKDASSGSLGGVEIWATGIDGQTRGHCV